MKKGLVVEYLNYIDDDGNAVGHGSKVLGETRVLLEGAGYSVSIMSSSAYNNHGKKTKKLTLFDVHKSSNNLKQHLKVFLNVLKAMHLSKRYDFTWFPDVDWRLLFVLGIFGNSRMGVTLYRDVFQDLNYPNVRFSKLKVKLVTRGFEKIGMVVKTNPNLIFTQNDLFIPDYYYTDKYEPYINTNKIDEILCLGAMRASKDLRGLLHSFANSKVSVHIIGEFQDKNELRWLLENKSSNIFIEDRSLSYKEYYTLMGMYKYIILPYDMKTYHNATSGILLETMFLRSVPIAPQELLNYNHVQGIGYDDIDKIPSTVAELEHRAMTVKNDISPYMRSQIQDRVSQAINKLQFN